MKVSLEARIVGPKSEVTLSPFRVMPCDSPNGVAAFASIEVLTLSPKEWSKKAEEGYMETWEKFAQEVFDIWCTYKDDQGNQIYPRPHMAKQWNFLKYTNPETKTQIPIIDYLKETVYNEARVTFANDLTKIGQLANPPITLQEMKDRFSDKTLCSLLFD